MLALTQVVAQLAGIFVAYGWGATGAATVAATPSHERPQLYRQSLRARSILYIVVAPVTMLLMLALSRGDIVASLLGSAVYLLPQLGANWYFTGEARPMRVLLLDTAPTVCGTVLGVVAAAFTGELWAFLLLQGIGFLGAVVLSAATILRGSRTAGSVRLPLREVLRDQRPAVVATATSAFYVGSPVIVVQLFLPAMQPMYALADRLFRYAPLAFLPVQQFFQGWVPGGAGLSGRIRRAVVTALLGGLAGGALIAVLSPLASTLLSGGALEVPLRLSVPLGVAFVGVATSSVVGYACLVAVGRVRALAVSTLIGAGVGAPLIVAFAAMGSLELVAWAVAISELCVAGYQVLTLRRALRARGEEAARVPRE